MTAPVDGLSLTTHHVGADLGAAAKHQLALPVLVEVLAGLLPGAHVAQLVGVGPVQQTRHVASSTHTQLTLTVQQLIHQQYSANSCLQMFKSPDDIVAKHALKKRVLLR